MSPADAALIANVRAQVANGEFMVVVRKRAAIFSEDIVGLADDELLAFIAGRLANSIEG